MTPKQHLEAELDRILATTGAPALAAVLVRDKGKTRVTAVRGVRRIDRPAGEPANKVIPNDRFCIGSVSKPVSGYLLAALIEKKVFPKAWKTRIVDVFPELASPACRALYAVRREYLEATVEQLMGHTAFFRYAPTHGFDFNNFFSAFSGTRLTEHLSRGSTQHRSFQYVIAAMQDPPDTPLNPEPVVPGEPPQYDSYGGSTMIATAMAERLTGKTFAELLKDAVLAPLGMTSTAIGRTSTVALPPDGPWQHWLGPSGLNASQGTALPTYDVHSHGPAGAIGMSAEDMATFIVANLSESGLPKAVVPDAALRQMQKPVAPIMLPGMSAPLSTGRSASGWIINPDHVWHTGNNGSSSAAIRVYPTPSYGVAAMTNTPDNAVWDQALIVLEDMQARWNTLFG